MHVIPLKKKYQLTEQDIDDLSRLLSQGCSLAHMAHFFEERISVEQLYLACGILAMEMYDTPLAELCPHLVEERKSLSSNKHAQWQKQKQEVRVMALIKEIIEDLSLYELELISGARN